MVKELLLLQHTQCPTKPGSPAECLLKKHSLIYAAVPLSIPRYTAQKRVAQKKKL